MTGRGAVASAVSGVEHSREELPGDEQGDETEADLDDADAVEAAELEAVIRRKRVIDHASVIGPGRVD